MASIIETRQTKCTFCKKEITWDFEQETCPECQGTCNDPFTGAICPYCHGEGYIECDYDDPCCSSCFAKQYDEEEEE